MARDLFRSSGRGLEEAAGQAAGTEGAHSRDAHERSPTAPRWSRASRWVRRREGCAAPRAGAMAPTTTYGPGAPCCPRTARLLPRYLALVDQRRRQRPMPATWERGPACAAPALPLPLAQSFTVNDRVVTEASGAPAASPHASTVLRGCDRSQDFRRDGPTGVPGVPGRSMQVSAVRPTHRTIRVRWAAGCRRVP